ncbi:hypothetical protein D0Z00_001760 [Geotrichum galactomycetum]|uniref:Uncharacterized protein n=1 Tax=Geotrichum galactomycetum TaxID=27317 RepID=A0ACB6V621_9ASCO|nr:hypothetical protein D0Z00_001760 [Geotrichum candidum]
MLVIIAFCGRAVAAVIDTALVTKIAGIIGFNAVVVVVVVVVVVAAAAAGYGVIVIMTGVVRLGQVAAATIHVAGQFSVKFLQSLFRFSWGSLTPLVWFGIAAVTVIVSSAVVGIAATAAISGASTVKSTSFSV